MERCLFFIQNGKREPIDPEKGRRHGYTVLTPKSESRPYRSPLWLEFGVFNDYGIS